MSDGFAIHDVVARPLVRLPSERGEAWPLLRFEDHLLRRFGLAELVRIEPESSPEMRARPAADEIWVLTEGRAEFAWRDLRPGSPSEGREDRLTCDVPTLVLAPFGVAFGCRALGGRATLVRFATHPEAEGEEIRVLPWGDV
jgi:hypothetical protein